MLLGIKIKDRPFPFRIRVDALLCLMVYINCNSHGITFYAVTDIHATQVTVANNRDVQL